MSWSRLVGAARAECICATEGCHVPPRWELEVGGVSSLYCSPCRDKIEKQKPLADHDLAYTNPRAYNQFI